MPSAAKADVHQCHGPVEGMKRAHWIQCCGRSSVHDAGIGSAREVNRRFKLVEHRFEHRLGDGSARRTDTTSPINAGSWIQTGANIDMFRMSRSTDPELLRLRLGDGDHAVENMAARAAETISISPCNTAKHPSSVAQVVTVATLA